MSSVERPYSIKKEGNGVHVTFHQGMHANITRAMLLMAGKSPQELGLTAHTEKTVRAQAEDKDLVLKDMSMSDFHSLFTLVHKYNDMLHDRAFAFGVDIDMLKVHHNSEAKVGEPSIIPAFTIVGTSFGGANPPHVQFAQDLVDNGIVAKHHRRESDMIDLSAFSGMDYTPRFDDMLAKVDKFIKGNGKGHSR